LRDGAWAKEGIIIHRFAKNPGEPVNKSRNFTATDCGYGSCDEFAVVKNSLLAAVDLIVHLRVFTSLAQG
jgi:hypothetical protein